VQDTIAYDGFGNITSESNTSFGDRWKWTGREYDSNTGLQYSRARFYDPKAGRWTTEDPLGFASQDINLYRYVRNNPGETLDASGLVAIFFDGAEQTEKSRTIIYRLYEASKDPNKFYEKSPVAWKNLQQFEKQAVGAAKRILDVCIKAVREAKKKEPIDLIGWSRGAALAIATANTIEEFAKKEKIPISIRFMGLIDPVSTAVIRAPSKIPEIVAVLWLGIRDKTKDKQDPKSVLFPIIDVKLEDSKRTKLIKKTYSLTHGQMGFDATVAKDLYDAAKAAGMTFNPLKPK
jgi:RHS repeat-associated protein